MKTVKIIRNGTEAQYGPQPSLARRRRTRLTPAQSAILDHLADQPEPCTVTALAELMHQHPNTVREHLDALVTAGAATRTPAPTVGRGRPAWLYAATTESRLSDDAQEYASLAAALAGQIARTSANPAADADAAGMEWGRDLIRTAMAAADSDGNDDTPDPDPTQAARSAELRARRRVVAGFALVRAICPARAAARLAYSWASSLSQSRMCWCGRMVILLTGGCSRSCLRHTAS